MTAPLLSFSGLPHTPQNHFKLRFYAAVLEVTCQALQAFAEGAEAALEEAPDGRPAALRRFPFLAAYLDELADFGLEGMTLHQARVAWGEALLAWEAASPGLPLEALRQAAGLEEDALLLLFEAGLVEEDARFGELFAWLQALPGQHRPTLALLDAWRLEAEGDSQARSSSHRLLELGLIETVNPEAPRLEWAFQPCAPLWDALRGERRSQPLPGCRYLPPGDLLPLDELVIPDRLRRAVEAVPALFAAGQVQTLVVRGPQHNGRRTLLGALARLLGRGLLEVHTLSAGGSPHGDERWRLIGPLASLLGAMPVMVFDIGPGELAHLPRLPGYAGATGVVMGRLGGLGGAGAESLLTLTLDMPGPSERRQLWQRSLAAPASPADLEAISQRLRLTSGNIQRAAQMAQAWAALEGRPSASPGDVRQACRALNRQALETLAQHVDLDATSPSSPWEQISVREDTAGELLALENRCRQRERLPAAAGATLAKQLSAAGGFGVRTLFSGPSGTGKTLAARLLAQALQMDLYRLDLAAVVNKYIGETEKNLNQAFARAEELDVILLLDEGDALLTQRTAVSNANDRYANLETNFLLQRIESYQGILVVTTNAGERIDPAFRRRMDVVVEFHLPDAAERWAIWQSHLPADHAVEAQFLREVANRCQLTGAQIRNAVLHAVLLALSGEAQPNGKNGSRRGGQAVTTACLEEAVRREYRKSGAVCPLRPLIPLEMAPEG